MSEEGHQTSQLSQGTWGHMRIGSSEGHMECIWGNRNPHKKGKVFFRKEEGGAHRCPEDWCLPVVFSCIPGDLPRGGTSILNHLADLTVILELVCFSSGCLSSTSFNDNNSSAGMFSHFLLICQIELNKIKKSNEKTPSLSRRPSRQLPVTLVIQNLLPGMCSGLCNLSV